MNIVTSLCGVIFFVTLVLAAPSAIAHPHIFSKYTVDIVQKDKNTINLHFTFTIHNIIVSNPLYRDQQMITENLFDALGQHPFYLFLDINGHSLGQQNVDIIRAGGTDDAPIYTFDMDIPADSGSFGFSIYDPEYYDSISLAGADSLKVNSDSFVCQAASQEVGRTMWGINRATHIECGDKTRPLPSVSFPKHNKFENYDSSVLPSGQNQMLIP